MDSRPFCQPCKRRYRCKRNEVAIRYGHEDRPPEPGCSVAVGDLWECPSCGQEIIIGWAYSPWRGATFADESDPVFLLAKAIDASGKGYVALGAVKEGAE